MKNKTSLILVTGQSGSGLGTAIRILEDLGFYCIDNLPFELIIPTLDALEKRAIHYEGGIALGIHIHSMEQAKLFDKLHDELKKKLKVEVLYLMTQDNRLLTRFSTTRRKHPFESDPSDLISAIHREKELLTRVENKADYFIDTTDLSPQDLALEIEQHYFPNKKPRKLFVTVTSFGFKHGATSPLDSMFDVRFLKNPFFNPKLKDKNGLDKEVVDFIVSDKEAKEFIDKLVDMNTWLIPRYHKEGKHYFRIGIGCTGGKHRSVCIAEILSTQLKETFSDIIDVKVYHRDISH